MVWFSEGLAGVLGRTAWLGLVNPLRTPQEVVVRVLPEVGAEREVRTTVPGRQRVGVGLHEYVQGNFGTEVEWPQVGATSLVMWDAEFKIPTVAQPTLGCRE